MWRHYYTRKKDDSKEVEERVKFPHAKTPPPKRAEPDPVVEERKRKLRVHLSHGDEVPVAPAPVVAPVDPEPEQLYVASDFVGEEMQFADDSPVEVYNVGDKVQIRRSTGAWVDGKVVKRAGVDKVMVEYVDAGMVFNKKMSVHSDSLRHLKSSSSGSRPGRHRRRDSIEIGPADHSIAGFADIMPGSDEDKDNVFKIEVPKLEPLTAEECVKEMVKCLSCPVCLELQPRISVFSCGHIICGDCFTKIRKKKECPSCRKRVEISVERCWIAEAATSSLSRVSFSK